MKKNIVIIILTLTTISFAILSLTNKIEAKRQTEISRELLIKQKNIAEEAELQIILLEDRLEKCNKNR